MKQQLISSPPKQEDVVNYFLKKGLSTFDAEAFYIRLQARNWRTSEGTPIKNWRVIAHRWIITHNAPAASLHLLTLKLNVQLSGQVTSNHYDNLSGLLQSILQFSNKEGSINNIGPQSGSPDVPAYDKETEKKKAKSLRLAGKTYDEIARILGRGKGTIHHWLNEKRQPKSHSHSLQ